LRSLLEVFPDSFSGPSIQACFPVVGRDKIFKHFPSWPKDLNRLALVLELHANVFFAGSDLPDGAVLTKLDFSLGFRFDL